MVPTVQNQALKTGAEHLAQLLAGQLVVPKVPQLVVTKGHQKLISMKQLLFPAVTLQLALADHTFFQR